MQRRSRIVGLENAARQALGLPSLVPIASSASVGSGAGEGTTMAHRISISDELSVTDEIAVRSWTTDTVDALWLVAANGKALASGGRTELVIGHGTDGETLSRNLALKGDSYRLKDRDLARPPADRTPETA